MFISRLHLKNFKRFSDLTIDLSELFDPPKLVLLTGKNGCGKSSVFDAFEAVSFGTKFGLSYNRINLKEYFTKNSASYYSVQLFLKEGKEIIVENNSFVIGKENISVDSFYGRSSLRLIPQLTRKHLGEKEINFLLDSDRPQLYIEKDIRFENDLEQITGRILKEVFEGDVESSKIKETYINPINEAFSRIFGENENTSLQLKILNPPLDGNVAEILFQKGKSKIHYNLLSSGEKEVFNILINLLARRKYFQNTIYFYDEIDLHLNTELQKKLLKEITENWIPENCQFWTASHSLGFIDYANESSNAAIIDFDDLDFDATQLIKPTPKNDYDIFEIAVNKEVLSKMMVGKRIIFAENTDAPLYNNLNIENTLFFTGIDKKDVFFKSRELNYEGLIDRDYLTDEEIQTIIKSYPNLKILNYYSLENYLFHPDNLEEYFKNTDKVFKKEEYTQQLVNEKKNIYDELLMGIDGARRGYPFFKENTNDKLLKGFHKNYTAIKDLLRSDELEEFYKVFPVKDYGKNIPARQNLSKKELAKTNWFKNQISDLIY